MRLSIDHLGPGQRRLVFFMIIVGGIALLAAITLLLASFALNSGERAMAQSLMDTVTVREYAALPDDDAYPAAVAVAPDGAVYSGSFATGAIWRIDPDGTVTELPDTRDVIGAVSGLTVAPDGSLLVVDQVDADPRTAGGMIRRIDPAGAISPLIDMANEGGFVTPDDITLDAAGLIYVTDRGRNEVWRYAADGTAGAAWFVPPASPIEAVRGAVTGLAYDPTTDTILVTDPDINRVYRVGVADGAGEILYEHAAESVAPPGFDGVTVTPDGAVYIAALGQNGVVTLVDDTFEYLAGNFRGAVDVAFAAPDQIFVANFDQSSLVLPLVNPQLPFAIDVIDLNAAQ